MYNWRLQTSCYSFLSLKISCFFATSWFDELWLSVRGMWWYQLWSADRILTTSVHLTSIKRLWRLCGKRLQVLTQWPGRSLKFGNLATKLTIRGNSLVIFHYLLSDFFSTALIDITLPSPTLIFLLIWTKWSLISCNNVWGEAETFK